MSSNRFTLYLALYFLIAVNLPLNLKLVELVTNDPNLDIGFVLTLPLFFVAVFFLVFWFFTLPFVLKPVSVAIIVVSSLVSYSMYNYGVVFDYSMVQNVVETNSAEARSYLNLTSIVWVIAMGLVPSVFVLRTQVVYKPWPKELAHKTLGFIGSVFGIGLIALFYSADYSSFGRNNAYLSKMIIPTEYLAASFKYLDRNLLHEPPKFQRLGTDAKLSASQRQRPRLAVLILGETARSQNYQVNGYPRATNQFTEQLPMVSVLSVSSCGTATAVSVPCMFSRMSQTDFDDRMVRFQDNVIDVISRAGVQVRWLENDGGCKGVCDRVETWRYTSSTESSWCQHEFCDDLILLDEFDKAVADVAHNDALIVLHLNGSHGPTYFERYGEKFRQFTPDCQRSDIQNCTDQQIVNSYDNTILHTDFLIAEVIGKAKLLSDQWNTSLVYISDHGESLGENGIYLHGMPYPLSPSEQRTVPWMLWFSDQYREAEQVDISCLKEAAIQRAYSHDNLFDTLLGLSGVETKIYDESMDLLAPCSGGRLLQRS